MEKKKHYNDVNPSPDFAKLEENVLKYWQDNRIFEKSVENREAGNEFVFYDGPPFANGLPHYGHLLTGYVKDLFPRYQTMLGKKVERRFGWDCHGLPAEMGAEKDLGISGRAAIINYGIDKFNDKCRTDVMKYASEWEKYVNRQARWVDFRNDYKTMDRSFMESVMWAFGELFNKGLMYEAMRVMPYSWAAETPLSNFETRLDNSYRERKDTAITVGFRIPQLDTQILAWTTTPWTLPSNLALAVSPDMNYVMVSRMLETGEMVDYIMAESAYLQYQAIFKESTLVPSLEIKEGAYRIVTKDGVTENKGITKLKWEFPIKGSELIGLPYTPLFPYFANHPNAFKIIAGDFIEEGSGTGVVHIAPGFGEDDFRVAKDNGIDVVVPVDGSGKFTDAVPDYEGQNVFDANKPIIKRLREEGKIVHEDNNFIHNYPHCWRTDQPLIYRAMPSWYVEVTKFKDRMVELNKSINWIPEHVRDGLFGKWLEGARDWSISRNRFWGAPIPIWRTKSGKIKCVGSVAELEKLSGQKVVDLHRPYIDEIKFKIDGEEYTRVEDVLDCWFESGSMPYASQGLTGEKPKPADFIVEYTAQTRGWFYTMAVLGTALFDEIPFKNVICHGVVLGEPVKDPSTGKMVAQKLSKRLKNYPEPMDVFNQYGSDALRWFMLSSPIMRGAELTIDKDGKFIRDIIRLYIKPIWNAYNFFVLYANADGIKAEFKTDSANLMDKYILSKCSEAVSGIQKGLDGFDTPGAYGAIEQFFEVLNNWYIRRSKERFWKTEMDADKQSAYDTLYTVLHIICRAAAPLLPLLTEEIYKNLSGKESVHLADYPSLEEIYGKVPEHLSEEEKDELGQNLAIDEYSLMKGMDMTRDLCNAALFIRSAKNMRVRQPLSHITIYSKDHTFKAHLNDFREIIMDELNVKNVFISEELKGKVNYKLQLDFSKIGKRVGNKMKDIAASAKKGDWKLYNPHYPSEDYDLNTVTTFDFFEIKINDEILEFGEFEIKLEPIGNTGAAPLSHSNALVELNLNLTPELINEGLARDVVRMVQQARKDANLNITDRIELRIETKANIVEFADYIKEQTLAKSLELGTAQGKHVFENELEGEKIKIALSVA